MRPEAQTRQRTCWAIPPTIDSAGISPILPVHMVAWILKKILGSKNQRELRRLSPTVRRINEMDEQFKSLSDDELRAKTAAWKEELSNIPELENQWKKLDEILPEAFAVVKNAARRLKDRQHTFSVCDQPMVWDMVHF